MNGGRAPGEDGLTVEVLKALSDESVSHIAEIFEARLWGAEVDAEWGRVVAQLIPKEPTCADAGK
eukprot:4861965-Alexandrium_andersonii.AAC.1